MAGFFIPGIGQGGGANPNPNPDAFTQARFDAQTNELVLTTAGGVAIRVNLQGLVPNVVQGTIENIRIDGTNIVATTVGGQQIQLPLSQVLNGTDVTFTPTANINSNTVSDAIVEVDGKINNAYTDANFNIANGELTLTKPNGQDKVLDLSELMGVREFDYDDAAKKITVLDHIGAIVEVDLSMFATEVNGQQVVDGSVTVVAGDIGYDGQTSGIQANNVQDAIDELNGKFIEDITFDITIDPQTKKPKNTLNKTKNGQLEEVINHVVTDWQDLEHVHEITKQNIFDPSDHVIKGSYYYNHNNDNVTPDNTGKWGRTEIPFVRGKIYTVYKTKHISQVFVFLDDTGQVVGSVRTSGTSMGGNKFSKRYRIDTNSAPQNAVSFGFNVVIDANSNDYIDVNHEIMVFDEDLTQTFNALIPKTDGAEIVVNGNEVSIGFDPSGTNIVANTVNGALKYLDKQIFGVGNTLNNKVDRTELSQTSQANKVPQLGVDGKLHASMLPDLSINQVHSVQNKAEALNLITSNSASIGDVFIIQDQANAVYMYVNEQGADFDNKCAELTLGTGVVKVVNGQFADATGRVTVNANHITLSDGRTILEDELNSKIKSINGQLGTNGNIDLSIDKTSNNGIDFKVGNTSFGSVAYITDNQVQEIKDLFV